MADVFISYASEDRDRVRPLADALQKRGFNLWWDRSLAAGQDYASIIERELRGAKAVIVVWTRGSAASTFVRDEAGRARDEGRLVPVLLDAVQIPLGFGAFQAEDFTRWNGGATAPQMQLLEEALRAKLEGRDVNSAAVARKRRALMNRVRIVSVLTVILLVVGIAVGGKFLVTPQQHHATQQDLQAQLLQLLEEGRLTPEQAAQLAQSMGLEGGALGSSANSQLASNDSSSRSAAAPGASPEAGGVQLASDEQFSTDAQQAYQSAIANLLTHPDASVRLAALHLSDPAQRDAALQTLMTYAQAHPEDPLAPQMYVVAGAVGEANDSPLGAQALEAAANVAPQNASVWRMLSHSYRRRNLTTQADAAAQVGEGVQAQAQGQGDAAEQQLQAALPNLTSPQLRAPVASELGRIAERRGDFSSASARFAQAYSLREQTAQAAPASPAAQGLQADAQQLVLALNRSGRTQEACQRLQQAQEAHDVAAPDQQTLDQCQRVLRTPLRAHVGLAPQLRRAAVTPTPATTP